MMKIFELDFRRLVMALVPPRLRKPRLLEWLMALTYPVQLLYNNFRSNRKANLKRLSITPQVCYLTWALNDRYDFELRRIRITDPYIRELAYVYQEAENKPLFLGTAHPHYLYTGTETSVVSVDFVVLLPAGLRYAENEMRAFIDSYKLASKEYKIQLT